MCKIAEVKIHENYYEYGHDDVKIFNGEFDIKASQTMMFVRDHTLFEFTNIFDLIVDRKNVSLAIKSNMLNKLKLEYNFMKETFYKLSLLYDCRSKKFVQFSEKLEYVYSLIVWWELHIKEFLQYVLEQDDFKYYMCDDFHAEKIKSFAYSVYRAKLEQCLI